MELAFPSYHPMIVAAMLDPPHEVTQSLQSDASSGMEMLFHVGHILEGVVFFDDPPFILALDETFEELLFQSSPLSLLEGGVIVFVVGLEDMVQVLPPSGALIISDVL